MVRVRWHDNEDGVKASEEEEARTRAATAAKTMPAFRRAREVAIATVWKRGREKKKKVEMICDHFFPHLCS